MNITITGDIGSGKSTVAKLLSDKLNLIVVDTGALYREYASNQGLDVLEQNNSDDWSIDRKIDSTIAELGKTRDNQIFVSRLGWYFVPDAIKIYLAINPVLAARRIVEDTTRRSERHSTVDECFDYNSKRKGLELERYAKLYNLADPSGYESADIVVVVGKNNAADVCECITNAIDKKEYGFFIDPRVLIPTQSIRDCNMSALEDYKKFMESDGVKKLDIDLHKSGDLYYVNDGHPRVAAACIKNVKFIKTPSPKPMISFTPNSDIYDYEDLTSNSLRDEITLQDKQEKAMNEKSDRVKEQMKSYAESHNMSYEELCDKVYKEMPDILMMTILQYVWRQKKDI